MDWFDNLRLDLDCYSPAYRNSLTYVILYGCSNQIKTDVGKQQRVWGLFSLYFPVTVTISSKLLQNQNICAQNTDISISLPQEKMCIPRRY